MCETDYPSRDAVPMKVRMLRMPFGQAYWSVNSISPGPNFIHNLKPDESNLRAVWAAAYVRHAELLDSLAPRFERLEGCLAEASRVSDMTPAHLVWGASPEMEQELVIAHQDGRYGLDWLVKVSPWLANVDLPLLASRMPKPYEAFNKHTERIHTRHIVAAIDCDDRLSPADCQFLESRGVALDAALMYVGLTADEIIEAIDRGIPAEYAVAVFT